MEIDRLPTTRRRATGPLALCVVAWSIGCAPPPQAFPLRFDAALASGDREAVAALLTRASRPIFAAMQAGAVVPQGDPATSPSFRMAAPKRPTVVVQMQPSETAVVLTVRAGTGVTRDWVVVLEDGEWRLDLMATSARRPWL